MIFTKMRMDRARLKAYRLLNLTNVVFDSTLRGAAKRKDEQMRLGMFSAATAIALLPVTASAANYETRMVGQGQWLIYEGEPQTALLATTTGEPQCYQFADVLILLKNRDQASDQALLQSAARRGFTNYHAFCAEKGQQASNTRNVVVFLEGEAQPDNLGRITSASALASGVIRTTGDPSEAVLQLQNNKVAAAASQSEAAQQASDARTDLERQQAGAQATREAEAQAEVDAVRAKYATQFASSRSMAKPSSMMDSFIGRKQAKLTGAWSASQAQCDQDILMMIDNGGAGRVEWWRDTKSYGMLPWRTGSWSLAEDIVTFTFDHRVEFTFISGFKDEPVNETVQLNLVSISFDNLRLASPGPNSPALSILGADEKLFVRCPRV